MDNLVYTNTNNFKNVIKENTLYLWNINKNKIFNVFLKQLQLQLLTYDIVSNGLLTDNPWTHWGWVYGNLGSTKWQWFFFK